MIRTPVHENRLKSCTEELSVWDFNVHQADIQYNSDVPRFCVRDGGELSLKVLSTPKVKSGFLNGRRQKVIEEKQYPLCGATLSVHLDIFEYILRP